ncbi:hypothetical protein IP65_13080 [Novosphingobium sp. AAP1]|uniref:hypothetical protein n=1 Tax=Novosphingobium sp. AAP1 TaxID=1523413 RepID=UPI0006B9B0C5|nr:hypothetical protein [Novosphingobium sp. AAP1]KPF53340.1 hypothetical protein IP65_13080 [Novosphingobium sp. AAP1]
MLLAQCGIQTVPFMPSLIQEKNVGFDVAFNRSGTALMLQFKLGQSLTRFHRPNKSVPPPNLVRPFWRFAVDTAEPDGQFETLLKAEQDGAEVYYAAPRFTDWPHYASFFEQGQVLDNSVLVRPSAIRQCLDDQGATDGFHRIVYDRFSVHVCSTPRRIPEVDGEEAMAKLAGRIKEKGQPVSIVLKRIYKGFEDRASVRRRDQARDEPKFVNQEDGLGERAAGDFARFQRNERLARLSDRAKSPDDALAAAIGIELWTLGIQLVIALDKSVGSET